MIFLEGQFSLRLAAFVCHAAASGGFHVIHMPKLCSIPEVLLQVFVFPCSIFPAFFYFSSFLGFSFGPNLDGWSKNTSWKPSLCFSQNLNGLCRGPILQASCRVIILSPSWASWLQEGVTLFKPFRRVTVTKVRREPNLSFSQDSEECLLKAQCEKSNWFCLVWHCRRLQTEG